MRHPVAYVWDGGRRGWSGSIAPAVSAERLSCGRVRVQVPRSIEAGLGETGMDPASGDRVKALKRFLTSAILIALVYGYYRWPSSSVRKFGEAVDAADVQTVTAMVDVESIEKSFEEQVTEGVAQVTMARTGGSSHHELIRAQTRKRLASEQGRNFFNQFGNAETIIKHLVGNGGQKFGWRSEKWESPISYSIQDILSDTKLIFRFRGIKGWKLCAIEMSTSDMRKAAR
jgi:hypothetical protein